MPNRGRAFKDKEGQDQGLKQGETLGDHQDSAPVHPVGQDARKRRNKEDGNLAGEPYQAQEKRRVGQTVDEPAHGEALHPGADEGNALAAEEETIISVVQRRKYQFQPILFQRSA